MQILDPRGMQDICNNQHEAPNDRKDIFCFLSLTFSFHNFETHFVFLLEEITREKIQNSIYCLFISCFNLLIKKKRVQDKKNPQG